MEWVLNMNVLLHRIVSHSHYYCEVSDEREEDKMTKRRLFEIIGGVLSIALVASMIVFLAISITVTKGYYAYYEVELKTSEYGYVYAVELDSDSRWEKQIGEPIGVLLRYNFIDINKGVNVYKNVDATFGTLELIYREATIYQIGDKYYYRVNLLQKAF